MAIDEGVTEVADSDEEPMTSSPVVGPDAGADKLPAMASGQTQELQDALQNLHSNPQALGQDDAKSAPQTTAASGVDRCAASTDASPADQTDVKLEGVVPLKKERAALQISHPDVAIHPQMNSSGPSSGTVHVPVAYSSIRQLQSPPGQAHSCTAAQALDSSSAPKDACSKLAEDMANTCDSEAHDGRMYAGPSHVVSNESSQSRSEDIHQNASEYSETIFPSENAVHRSQAMGMSDTTKTLVATATNSLPTTTSGLTGPILTTVSSKERINIRPDPDSTEIRGQELRMNGGDRRPDVKFQESVAKTQEASPFTPQIRALLEKPQVRSLPLQKTPHASEPSQGLDTGDTATESQRQPPMGASPTTTLPNPLKTPQEITLSELKAQKASLLASLRNLPAVQVLIEEMASSDTGTDGGGDESTDADIMSAASKIVKQHIKLLHEYNELKDVGQGLMGLIADQRGVRIVEVQEEFGVDAKD